MRYSEKWGDSIDSAVELALLDLKLTKEQVKVTVLEEPTKGFFGIGSKLAKVRVEELAPEKPAKPATPEKPAKQEKAQKVERKESSAKKNGPAEKKEKRTAKKEKISKEKINAEIESFNYEEACILSEKPEDLVLCEEHPVKDFLTEVFAKMGLNVSLKVYTNKDSVYVDVEGPDCGTVIGKRGATLDSIQYLASLVENKDKSSYIRVVVDAEGYREKREKTLEKLAVRLAAKAVSTKRSVKLEPMNPYERKVIHSTLQKIEGVTTRSEGEEPYRKVIIEPVK